MTITNTPNIDHLSALLETLRHQLDAYTAKVDHIIEKGVRAEGIVHQVADLRELIDGLIIDNAVITDTLLTERSGFRCLACKRPVLTRIGGQHPYCVECLRLGRISLDRLQPTTLAAWLVKHRSDLSPAVVNDIIAAYPGHGLTLAMADAAVYADREARAKG